MDATLGALTVVAVGITPIAGALDTTLGALTVDAAGTAVALDPISGALAKTLGALTVDATSSVFILGTGVMLLAPLTASGTATLVTLSIVVHGTIRGPRGHGSIRGSRAAGRITS